MTEVVVDITDAHHLRQSAVSACMGRLLLSALLCSVIHVTLCSELLHDDIQIVDYVMQIAK